MEDIKGGLTGAEQRACVKGAMGEEFGAERRRQWGQKFSLLDDDRVLGN